jgi:hypothetical protein
MTEADPGICTERTMLMVVGMAEAVLGAEEESSGAAKGSFVGHLPEAGSREPTDSSHCLSLYSEMVDRRRKTDFFRG